MRKLLAVVLGVVFVGLGVSDCFAAYSDSTAIQEYEYSIVNDTGVKKTTVIPITSIRPLVDKITGYAVTPNFNGGGSETYIGIYDDTTVACVGEKFGEMETPNATALIAGENFMRPKKITNGVVVIQGANTTAIVYFTGE